MNQLSFTSAACATLNQLVFASTSAHTLGDFRLGDVVTAGQSETMSRTVLHNKIEREVHAFMVLHGGLISLAGFRKKFRQEWSYRDVKTMKRKMKIGGELKRGVYLTMLAKMSLVEIAHGTKAYRLNPEYTPPPLAPATSAT